MKPTTIAAIATPNGRGAVGIIRVSGPKTKAILGKVFTSSARLKPHGLQLGWIVSGGQKVDQVLVAWMPAPHCFTGEDMAEIQAHGNPTLLAWIMEILVAEGAQAAGPGEFSKRAYLNGKIDLAQAEAIMQVVEAESAQLLRLATRQLSGVFSKRINHLSEQLARLAAGLTADLDFAEEDTPAIEEATTKKELKQIRSKIQELLEGQADLPKLQNGIQVAIVGLPNAGKSTLLNSLLGYDRAIVTEVAGTTRDLVTENVEINGLRFYLIDTAGLNTAPGRIEAEGIRRSVKTLQTADLCMVLIEPGQEAATLDYLTTHQLFEPMRSRPEQTVVVYTKADLGGHQSLPEFEEFSSAVVSCKQNRGLDTLKSVLVRGAGLSPQTDRMQVISTRQISILQAAEKQLTHLLKQARQPADILLVEITEIITLLNSLSGRDTSAQVIDEVFKNFCIGK